MKIQNRESEKKFSFLLPLTLALASVCLRSIHLNWGLPELSEEALPMKKAFEMNGWVSGIVQLNPETAGWPSLSFYIHMFLQQIQFHLGKLTGDFTDQGDFFLQKITWFPIAIWARAVGVFAVSIIVWSGSRLGGRFAGFAGGVIAGSVLLSSPLLTRSSHLITPDILVLMFSGLALHSLVNIVDRGSRSDYLWAGLWIGLGISSKYTPGLLLPCLFLAHFFRNQQQADSSIRRTLLSSLPWLTVAVSTGVFLLTSPFLFSDLASLMADVKFQSSHLTGGHFGHTSQGPGLVFYVKDVLGPGIGWPAFVFGVSGLVFSAVGKGGKWWVILSAFLVFYLPLALIQTRFDRYMLPALLPLALGIAGGWTFVEPILLAKGKIFRNFTLVLLLAVLVLLPVRNTWAFLDLQGKPGTLELARNWILSKRNGPGPYLVMEHYTPSLPRAFDLAGRLNDPATANLSQDQQQVWLDIDPVNVVYLPMYSTLGGDSGFFYDLRHFSGFDYVVTSSSVRGRYENDPQLYPEQNHFYDELEKLEASPVVFSPNENYRGPEIRIYSLEEMAVKNVAGLNPPLKPEDFSVAREEVAAAHLSGFTRSIARLAYERGLYGLAARYNGGLNVVRNQGSFEEGLRTVVMDLVRHEQWNDAEPLLRQWSREDSENPEPLAVLGFMEMKRGNNDLAMEQFQSALELTDGRNQFEALRNRILRFQSELKESSR